MSDSTLPVVGRISEDYQKLMLNTYFSVFLRLF